MDFRNEVFNGGTYRVDGNQYFGCSFKDGVLEYAGGEIPGFDATGFENCSWRFVEAAARTVGLLQAISAQGKGPADFVAGLFGQVARVGN